MDNYFLILSLFFPRCVLVWYYFNSWMPLNFVPLWGDVLMSVFVPRILILVYIYQNFGADNIWFIIHCLVCVLVYASRMFSSSDD
jgi:hypothetical protein